MSEVQQAYKHYLEHLKEEHPRVYARVKPSIEAWIG